ncbi:mediator of RNA polymerase II transcription subunit 12 isoform X1 [Sabethes cyaneus]|uniref:mediator of RNA polymerase II transcription subunit 12 isoform X1 n=1 Tax=Sabethes cyaneus TaxID=53552 RepID=UPI00237EB38B|nr:mediator of RNA polymerase II transcription subunit 12 isoform X1 [Sabethes cyaneus]
MSTAVVSDLCGNTYYEADLNSSLPAGNRASRSLYRFNNYENRSVTRPVPVSDLNVRMTDIREIEEDLLLESVLLSQNNNIPMGRCSSPSPAHCFHCDHSHRKKCCLYVGDKETDLNQYSAWKQNLESSRVKSKFTTRFPEAVSGDTTPYWFPKFTYIDQIKHQEAEQPLESLAKKFSISFLLNDSDTLRPQNMMEQQPLNAQFSPSIADRTGEYQRTSFVPYDQYLREIGLIGSRELLEIAARGRRHRQREAAIPYDQYLREERLITSRELKDVANRNANRRQRQRQREAANSYDQSLREARMMNLPASSDATGLNANDNQRKIATPYVRYMIEPQQINSQFAEGTTNRNQQRRTAIRHDQYPREAGLTNAPESLNIANQNTHDQRQITTPYEQYMIEQRRMNSLLPQDLFEENARNSEARIAVPFEQCLMDLRRIKSPYISRDISEQNAYNWQPSTAITTEQNTMEPRWMYSLFPQKISEQNAVHHQPQPAQPYEQFQQYMNELRQRCDTRPRNSQNSPSQVTGPYTGTQFIQQFTTYNFYNGAIHSNPYDQTPQFFHHYSPLWHLEQEHYQQQQHHHYQQHVQNERLLQQQFHPQYPQNFAASAATAEPQHLQGLPFSLWMLFYQHKTSNDAASQMPSHPNQPAAAAGFGSAVPIEVDSQIQQQPF